MASFQKHSYIKKMITDHVNGVNELKAISECSA